MRSRGQASTPFVTIAMAAAGEGGSCGHHQLTAGWRCATRAATCRALADCGEERKPCRYSRCVVCIGRMVFVSLMTLFWPAFFAKLPWFRRKVVEHTQATATGRASQELIERSVAVIVAQARGGLVTALVVAALLGFLLVPHSGWLLFVAWYAVFALGMKALFAFR